MVVSLRLRRLQKPIKNWQRDSISFNWRNWMNSVFNWVTKIAKKCMSSSKNSISSFSKF